MVQVKKLIRYIGMVLLLFLFLAPLRIEAKGPEKDMKNINMSNYCNKNIEELNKQVKLIKGKKNEYHDKYRTTKVTTNRKGNIIKVSIKGDTKKALKYAPSFGGISLGDEAWSLGINLTEVDSKFPIYDSPYSEGVDSDEEEGDYVLYTQKKNSYDTLIVRSKLLKWYHSGKKVYKISWKKNGAISKNAGKYGYHDVDAEIVLEKQEEEVQGAEAHQEGTDSKVFEDANELSIADRISMYQEQCIYIEDTEDLLRNPSTYDGKQILIRGRINPVTEELLSLESGDDIYLTNRVNLFDSDYNKIEKILKGDSVFVSGVYHVGGIDTLTRTWNCIDDAFIILGN